MSRDLSTAAKRAIYSQETDEVYVSLLTIDNPSFTAPIRVCSDPFEELPEAGVRGIISRGIEYLYVPFIIELPSQDDSGNARARVSIDNVDRRIVEAVRNASTSLSITIEIVLASNPDIVEINVSDFRLDKISYDSLTVSGDISVDYFDLEPFPSRRFTPADFPGIF